MTDHIEFTFDLDTIQALISGDLDEGLRLLHQQLLQQIL